MLSSSVPMSRCCCPSVLKLFLRMVFASLCRLLQLASHSWQPVCFLIASNTTVGRDPLEGHRCFVLKQGQLLSDVAEDLVPSWWFKTLQGGPTVSQKHCVGRKSLFLVQSLGCCKQGVGFSSVVCWLLPCSYRLPDGSAIGQPNENKISVAHMGVEPTTSALSARRSNQLS